MSILLSFSASADLILVEKLDRVFDMDWRTLSTSSECALLMIEILSESLEIIALNSFLIGLSMEDTFVT